MTAAAASADANSPANDVNRVSSQNVVDDFTVDVGQPALDAIVVKGQLPVIDPEKVQHRRQVIVDLRLLLGSKEAYLVGRAVGVAGLQAGAGHPDGEPQRMMVAPG